MGLPRPTPGSAMLRKLLGPGKRQGKISQQPVTFWSLALPSFRERGRLQHAPNDLLGLLELLSSPDIGLSDPVPNLATASRPINNEKLSLNVWRLYWQLGFARTRDPKARTARGISESQGDLAECSRPDDSARGLPASG
jgi:hypothetical protein